MDIRKHRYEKAYESLESLRFATAGTRLGGEVQFLLGETRFKSGKYQEAQSHYMAYLNSYPGGPFAEKALYFQALSMVRQIEKRKIGFFAFRTYIPHDRDISILRDARVLFQAYMEKYPDGEWYEKAAASSQRLLTNEARHELEIARFYLRKGEYKAAVARAQRVDTDNFPADIRRQALELIQKAQDLAVKDEGKRP